MKSKNSPTQKFRVSQPGRYPRAPFPMCFTPTALESLLKTVGARPPETGAKGFSPADLLGFDVIEFDENGSANASAAVYSPNVEWGNERQTFHLNQPDKDMRLWSGDLHSHPGDFGMPSSKSGIGLGDMGYCESVFATNESMQWFLLPIITQPGGADITIHPWVVERGHNGKPPKLYVAEVVVCDPAEFPKRPFNPDWEQSIANKDVSELSENQKAIAAYISRTTGIVSPGFRQKTVALVGIGAGSYLAEKLARLCPAHLKLCDHDRVEIANLSRTAYTYEDARNHVLKVEALASRLRQINPFVAVEQFPVKLNEMTTREKREFFKGVDLIIAGTDDFHCQALCNEMAELFSIPAVFIGIHDGAKGGRVIWFIPDVTPCYRCIAHDRFEAVAASKNTSVNLVAGHGSIFDIQFVDTVAAKVAVAILERGQDSAAGRFYASMKNRHEIICRCAPDYEWGNEIWNALLDDLPKAPKDYAAEIKNNALLAMDTNWLNGISRPSCVVCGSHVSKV